MQWAQGEPLGLKEQSQAETLNDIATMSCNDMRGFYGLEEVESEQ